MLLYHCFECGHEQEVPESNASRLIKCPKCNASNRVPETASVGAISDNLVEPVSPESEISQSTPASNATRRPSGFWPAATVIIILLATLVVAFRIDDKLTAKQWEYKIESPSDIFFDITMERLGREGWELVTARRATGAYDKPSYEMIFKRPKQ